MRCVIVSHTHWDREWYRTFQAFRARLVDTVDRVLELVEADPGYHFQLDGQAIVLEDYLEIRPGKRSELERACASGRIGIGPWYVQPDSLLPSGEAHVRNLLEGRRIASAIGPCSTLAYTPDSFGHPAQFPQLFAGFGLGPFIYWRGNAGEIDELRSDYTWVAPDGSAVGACHLANGYFPAFGLGRDVKAAAARLAGLANTLAEKTAGDCVLLMNGIDHMLPDANTEQVARTLADAQGWKVERGLLDAYTEQLPALLEEFRGELLGGRVANLLPGVWSTRTYQKLRNRRCESLLEGLAEPFVALAKLVGAPDESPSLRSAWRALLPNQAHDSICGCSQDRVHQQMEPRYDHAEELAVETTKRVLERVAGLGVERQLPDHGSIDIAVFNPSPHARSGVVRLALEGYPTFTSAGMNPLLGANLEMRGFKVGGRPARVVEYADTVRPRLHPDRPIYDLEFVASDVPAFGWQRLHLEPSDPVPDQQDEGREIAAGDVRVAADGQGRLDVRFRDREFRGLGIFEDLGDRGDSYDFDPVLPDRAAADAADAAPEVRRVRHASGIQSLHVRHRLRIPAQLAEDRTSRSEQDVVVPVELVARVAPGVERVDLSITLDNTARDHRLRLGFPTGAPTDSFEAATTFGVARRSTAPRDDSNWIHPAPRTFPHQGWVDVTGLCVVAPGLPEAEVEADGTLWLTLVRAVGWLSRPDLRSRPGEAGPSLPTPGAQCPGRLDLKIALLPGSDSNAANALDAERELIAVGAGHVPLHPEDAAMLELSPGKLVLSALKPAEDGNGVIARVLNPTDDPLRAELRLGLPVGHASAVRLDESPVQLALEAAGSSIAFDVPAHALRSVRIEPTS